MTTSRYDVIVIGEGPAGFAAALGFAERGKHVAVVAKSPAAAAVSSGAWDFGTTEAWRRPLVNWRVDPTWQALHECGAEMARALEPHLSIRLCPEAPMALPTTDGTFKSVYAAQSWQAAADREGLRGKRVGLVSAPGWRWTPERIAARWTTASLDCRVLEWEWGLAGADWPLPHVAARLRDDEALGDRLVSWLEAGVSEADFFLFPPILLTRKVADKINRVRRIAWGECLAGNEPTAGWRLQGAMRETLAARGIARLSGLDIQVNAAARRVESLNVHTGEGWRALDAGQIVLATGRYFGGGLTLLPGGPRETLLGLPLFSDRENPIRIGDPEIFRKLPVWRQVGVWIDDRCQPLGTDGRPIWENVQACGSLIGGIDYARAGLGIGFFFYMGKQCAMVTE